MLQLNSNFCKYAKNGLSESRSGLGFWLLYAPKFPHYKRFRHFLHTLPLYIHTLPYHFHTTLLHYFITLLYYTTLLHYLYIFTHYPTTFTLLYYTTLLHHLIIATLYITHTFYYHLLHTLHRAYLTFTQYILHLSFYILPIYLIGIFISS